MHAQLANKAVRGMPDITAGTEYAERMFKVRKMAHHQFITIFLAYKESSTTYKS